MFQFVSLHTVDSSHFRRQTSKCHSELVSESKATTTSVFCFNYQEIPSPVGTAPLSRGD